MTRTRAIAIVAALVLGVGAVVFVILRESDDDLDERREARSAALLTSARVRETARQPVSAPAPPPADSAAAPAAPSGSVEPSAGKPPASESELMAHLRRVQGEDPELAIQLARIGNAMFPESAAAPERAAIIIHALAELGRPSEARGEAEQMVNDYPDSPWSREIEAFTGAHPHVNR
jgi:hypothetical protein